ncbi:hypothetical protein B7494_g3612 [Chlorociboria aeruginascens]|nr:hypothetical protein B7494_g3612 [Chlorociboria aeruginascens]
MPVRSSPMHDPREQIGSNIPPASSGQVRKKWVKRYRTEVAASFPLDSVKTRMQTYRYDNFTDCVRHTYQTEKFRGFFRGVTAPMASVTLVRTISFSVYQRSKYTYAAWFKRNFGIDPLVHVNTPGTYPTLSTIACFGAAGATAGSLITIVACPFELTKLSAQVSVLMADRKNSSVTEPELASRNATAASYQNKGTFKTAKNIVKHRGFAGLYSGFNLHLLRDTLGTGIYFMTYESSKQLLATYTGDRSPTNPLAVALAGGLCGVASWALIYPIDSAKSKLSRIAHRATMGKRKKAKVMAAAAKLGAGQVSKVPKATRSSRIPRATKEERRAAKLDLRRREKRNITADMWAAPTPPGLVAKLDIPKVKSKYQSYFEFAENTEKKEKKLEFKAGFQFVPIGDPTLTNACKELSREQDAMIFIVSGSKETNTRVSAHVYRTGYHFRSVIVDEARRMVGGSVASQAAGEVEPIPESQVEINKQADAAIRDLFPRIPNTDRQMIIEHAFQKGVLFQGEPTVGLQPTIPLSRRVQLAVLAHVRHTHTRYDKLLRETSWINARKVVEPLCLDVIVKWRGDEETGRDQMDEILREVVIITDSEDESSDNDDSDEEGEVSSESSPELPTRPNSPNQERPLLTPRQGYGLEASTTQSHIFKAAGSSRNPLQAPSTTRPQELPMDKRSQRGFKRYQAAWNDAVNRRQDPAYAGASANPRTPVEELTRIPPSMRMSPHYKSTYPHLDNLSSLPNHPEYRHNHQRHLEATINDSRQDPNHLQRRLPEPIHRNEVIVRTLSDRPMYYQDAPQRFSPPYLSRDQRPPLVVRGNQSQGLQDLLVPSIETASIDATVASPRLDRSYHTFEAQPKHPVRPRRQSPEFIIINDDSPQVKRRRVVREDDAGRFRPIPSHDHHYVSDSHLIPISSVQSRPPLSRRSDSVSHSQGLYQNMQPPPADPAMIDRIPVYGVPQISYIGEASGQVRRPNGGLGFDVQANPSYERRIASPQPLGESNIDNSHWRPAIGMRQIVEPVQVFQQGDPNRKDFIPIQASPAIPVSSRNLLHERNTGPIPDQDFIQSFSQSRIDTTLPQRRDSVLPSERPVRKFFGQERESDRNEDQSAQPFTTIRTAQRSPVQYIERPMYHREETRRPWSYEHYDPAERPFHIVDQPPTITRELPRPGADRPLYTRPGQPRRHVIVLE